jgi:bacteriocin-like protein
MKKFNQLSKAEMKKVNGGKVPPVCNVDNTCSVFIGSQPGDPLVGVLFAYCSTNEIGNCICSREYGGVIYYGDSWPCQGVS